MIVMSKDKDDEELKNLLQDVEKSSQELQNTIDKKLAKTYIITKEAKPQKAIITKALEPSQATLLPDPLEQDVLKLLDILDKEIGEEASTKIEKQPIKVKEATNKLLNESFDHVINEPNQQLAKNPYPISTKSQTQEYDNLVNKLLNELDKEDKLIDAQEKTKSKLQEKTKSKLQEKGKSKLKEKGKYKKLDVTKDIASAKLKKTYKNNEIGFFQKYKIAKELMQATSKNRQANLLYSAIIDNQEGVAKSLERLMNKGKSNKNVKKFKKSELENIRKAAEKKKHINNSIDKLEAQLNAIESAKPPSKSLGDEKIETLNKLRKNNIDKLKQNIKTLKQIAVVIKAGPASKTKLNKKQQQQNKEIDQELEKLAQDFKYEKTPKEKEKTEPQKYTVTKAQKPQKAVQSEGLKPQKATLLDDFNKILDEKINPSQQKPEIKSTEAKIENIPSNQKEIKNIPPLKEKEAEYIFPEMEKENQAIDQMLKSEQIEEIAKDEFLIAPTTQDAQSPDIGAEENLILDAIRTEILQKQQQSLQNNIINAAQTENEKKKLNALSPEKFRDYLITLEGKDKLSQIIKNPKIQQELNNIEIAGYKKIHNKFKENFKDIEWKASPDVPNEKVTNIKNDQGEHIASIKETTHNTQPITLTLEDGKTKTINSYRTIDFPKKLENGKGPMHLSMAVKDENGKNIPEKNAVYFTADYDENGKLTELSAPTPVQFMGNGADSIGYVERNGKIYTLPVTKEKYQEMMQEVALNKGNAVDLSQEAALSQDKISTAQKIDPNAHQIDEIEMKKPQKEVKIDPELSNKNKEETKALLANEIKKGNQEKVESIIEATKPSRKDVPKGVQMLQSEDYKIAYHDGMKEAKKAQNKNTQDKIHRASAILIKEGKIDPKTHIKLVQENTKSLNKGRGSARG